MGMTVKEKTLLLSKPDIKIYNSKWNDVFLERLSRSFHDSIKDDLYSISMTKEDAKFQIDQGIAPKIYLDFESEMIEHAFLTLCEMEAELVFSEHGSDIPEFVIEEIEGNGGCMDDYDTPMDAYKDFGGILISMDGTFDFDMIEVFNQLDFSFILNFDDDLVINSPQTPLFIVEDEHFTYSNEAGQHFDMKYTERIYPTKQMVLECSDDRYTFELTETRQVRLFANR